MTRAPEPRAKLSDLVDGLSRSLRGRRIVIAEPGRELPLALRGVSGASITIARFDAIDAAFLAEQMPDVILAPLMSPDHDILDLARVLAEAGYRGALRAYCAPLPRPDVVRREVAQIWPEGDFDILDVPPSAPPRAP